MIDEKQCNKDIGERVFKIRKVLKLSEEEMAEKIGISAAEYVANESGEDGFTVSHIMRIADMTPLTDIGYILEGRAAYDYYIETALKKITDKDLAEIKDELGISSESVTSLSDDALVKYTMKLYEYGKKHVNDADLREVEPIQVFTQMFEQVAKEAME